MNGTRHVLRQILGKASSVPYLPAKMLFRMTVYGSLSVHSPESVRLFCRGMGREGVLIMGAGRVRFARFAPPLERLFGGDGIPCRGFRLGLRAEVGAAGASFATVSVCVGFRLGRAGFACRRIRNTSVVCRCRIRRDRSARFCRLRRLRQAGLPCRRLSRMRRVRQAKEMAYRVARFRD